MTLFDLCLNRRYKSGLNFLLNHCKIEVTPEQLQLANSIIEEGSSVRSIYDNGVSMADRTSQGSGAVLTNRSLFVPSTEEKKVRHLSRGRNNARGISLTNTPASHHAHAGYGANLPQLNTGHMARNMSNDYS